MAAAGTAVGGVAGAFGEKFFAQFSGPAHRSSKPHAKSASTVSADAALQRLRDGNSRFVAGKLLHPHETRNWRAEIAEDQHPFAAVLGCADSRVPPEIVFDAGLGDLFVIRQAGNVADDDSLGSLEYAVAHLQIPLIVVLGHEHCGAVTAAVDAVAREKPVEGHVLRLVDDIAPAVWETKEQSGDLVELAVRANIQQVVEKLRKCLPILRPRVDHGSLRIVGAYYHLKAGTVEWLKD